MNKLKLISFILILLLFFINLVFAQDQSNFIDVIHSREEDISFLVNSILIDDFTDFSENNLIYEEDNLKMYYTVDEGFYDNSIAIITSTVYEDSIVYEYNDTDYTYGDKTYIKVVDYYPQEEYIEIDKVYFDSYDSDYRFEEFYQTNEDSTNYEINNYNSLYNINYTNKPREQIYNLENYNVVDFKKEEASDFEGKEKEEFNTNLTKSFRDDITVGFEHKTEKYNYNDDLLESENEHLYYNNGYIYK